MNQVAITRPSASQHAIEARCVVLAEGGITVRGYMTSVDRPRRRFLIKQLL